MASTVNDKKAGKVLWLQWIGGAAAMITLFSNALMRGWSSPYLAQLLAEDSPLPITTDEASWIASLINLGRLTGAIVGAVSVHFYSCRKTLIASGIPLALGWIFAIVADSAVWLYLARFTCGAAMGMVFSSFPLYLGEISSPKIRGTLVTLALSGVTAGILAGNILGTYVSMAVFSYVSLVPTISVTLLFVWLPESPHDLTRINKLEKAKLSIERYNPKVDADVELKHVMDFVRKSQSITFLERLREFNSPQNRKSGLVIFLLFVFMQFSGLNTIMFYTETILTSANLTVVTPATMVIIGNVIGTGAAFVATYTADKCGRKILLIISSAGICASLLGLGVHFTLIDTVSDSSKLQWLPIISMVAYKVFVAFGHAIVPNMVLSELFAPTIKSLASCLAGITTGGFGFAATRTYQPTVDALGMAYVFWINAIIMALCILFVVTLMPETRRKSLQEIQDKLGRT